jgi:SAM-dependent methyltransferase
VAFGLAIGVTPLWGFHFFLVLAVCWPLRLDVPLSYLAANISIPLIAPFLTMAELEIGSFLLTGASLPMSLALVKAKGAGLFVREIAVGTLVFSPVVASFGGALTYAAVRLARRGEQRAPRPVLDLAFDRVAARYAAGKKRAAYYYVRGKLAGDPVARVIADLAAKEPLGTVIDAGSGRGQLSLLLLEQNLATRVTGFDWDEGKVAIATRASLGLPASFRTGDLTSPLGEEADTGMLIDVLHYLTDAEQEAALTNVARAARRTVLVRELDPDRGWRSTVTRIQEWVTTGLRYNRGKRVRVRPIRELSSVLEREGFKVDVQPCWGGTPFANVLLVARRVRIE